MSSKLSLTLEQLEKLCDVYHQLLEFSDKLERDSKKFPELVKMIKSGKPSKLLTERIVWYFNPTREVTADKLFDQLGGVSALSDEHFTKRTLERKIANLLASNILVAKKGEKTKGQWSMPYSRHSKSGRPASSFSLNPQLFHDYVSDIILNEYEGSETRNFWLFAEKFLLETPAVEECCERILAAYYGMIASHEFVEFVDIVSKFPEMDSRIKSIQNQTDIKLEEAREYFKTYAFLIPAEKAPLSKIRTLFNEEYLPWQEVRRLVDSRLL
jgi:hypothetical protein